MNLKEAIKSKSKEFLSLCKSHDVVKLYAFGSSITEKFNEDLSDIDLLVEIETDDPINRGENLLDLWDRLEIFFQRKVDLLTTSSIRNPILKQNIESTKVLIYDGQGQKVSI